MAARAYQRDGSLSGLATALTDLDSRMGGLQPSDLIIIAARPSMGKTAWAINISRNRPVMRDSIVMPLIVTRVLSRFMVRHFSGLLKFFLNLQEMSCLQLPISS